ncbi:MAG: hypothetical protein GY703_26035 [Gammaproteobacteria bacterium]|nr:hypothetical protein [Gammaproteobacteria bacterium]
MVRKLSLAIAMVLGVVPFGVQALGLGEIRTKSSLNQNLNADIKLLSVSKTEMADVRINLAPAAVFNQAGIERPHFLTRLEFKAMTLPDGSQVIRVSSPEPVREPFVNFFIEVDWPNGHMLREFTVLLDPPVTTERQPAPVQKPRGGQSALPSRPVRSARPAPEGSNEAGNYGPTRRNETLWGIAEKVRHQGTTMEQMVMSLFYANPEAFLRGNVNNLKVGKILRVPSREEVMEMRSGEARTAFRAQMNDWRTGTGGAATAEVAATPATADLEPEAVESTPVMAGVEPESPDAQLTIIPAQSPDEPSEVESDNVGARTDQLRRDLAMANERTESALEEGQELRSRIVDLESQLNDLQRLFELKSDQLAEMQSQFSGGMPAQMEMPAGVDGIVTQADGNLTGGDTEKAVTGMPGDSASQPEREAPPELASGMDGEVSPGETPTDVMQGADAITKADLPVVEEAQSKADMASDSMEKTLSTAPPASETVSPTPLKADAGKAEPKPKVAEKAPSKPAKAVKEPAVAEKSLLDKFLGDTTLMGIAAAVVVVLGALVWLVAGRRRKEEEEFPESILINTSDDEADDVVASEPDLEAAPQSEDETSFLSDFATEDDEDPLQTETGDVDPLTEADVYVAYGRYKQAEELIRQALDREPGRVELKEKLFEILYAVKDKQGFNKLAEKSAAEGIPKSDPQVWDRVVAMGSKIIPGSALFAAGVAGLGDTLGGGDDADDQLLGDLDDLDLEADFSSEQEDTVQPEPLADIEGLELGDLDSTDSVLAAEPVEDAIGESTEEIMDFDLDFDLDEETFGEGVADRIDEVEQELLKETPQTDLIDQAENLDFTEEIDLEAFKLEDDVDTGFGGGVSDEQEISGLDLFTGDSATDDTARISPEGIIEIEDDLKDLSLEELETQIADNIDITTPVDTDPTLADLSDSSGGEITENDLMMDIEPLTLSVDEGDMGIESTENTALDEVGVKLDLARAYVDMEDAEGARSILNEVLLEGNEEQKAAAQKIIGELS